MSIFLAHLLLSIEKCLGNEKFRSGIVRHLNVKDVNTSDEPSLRPLLVVGDTKSLVKVNFCLLSSSLFCPTGALGRVWHLRMTYSTCLDGSRTSSRFPAAAVFIWAIQAFLSRDGRIQKRKGLFFLNLTALYNSLTKMQVWQKKGKTAVNRKH